jgi:hypothetical protein
MPTYPRWSVSIALCLSDIELYKRVSKMRVDDVAGTICVSLAHGRVLRAIHHPHR